MDNLVIGDFDYETRPQATSKGRFYVTKIWTRFTVVMYEYIRRYCTTVFFSI